MHTLREGRAEADAWEGRPIRSAAPALEIAIVEPALRRETDASSHSRPAEAPHVRHAVDPAELLVDSVTARALASDLRRASAALRQQATALAGQARSLAAATQDICRESARLRAEAGHLTNGRTGEPMPDAGGALDPCEKGTGGSDRGV